MKEPKQNPEQEQPGASPAQEKTYQIVGLQLSAQMPINFEGREYDLASLTDQEADYLLGFPDQIPYLKRN